MSLIVCSCLSHAYDSDVPSDFELAEKGGAVSTHSFLHLASLLEIGGGRESPYTEAWG